MPDLYKCVFLVRASENPRITEDNNPLRSVGILYFRISISRHLIGPAEIRISRYQHSTTPGPEAANVLQISDQPTQSNKKRSRHNRERNRENRRLVTG